MTTELMPLGIDEFLVKKPEFDLKEKLREIVETTRNLEVTTEDHFHKVTTLYSESKDWEKRIEFLRKQANGPDQDRINARNDKAKELLNPLRTIQSLAKSKCDQYQHLLEARKQEAESKAQQAVELLGLEEPVYVPALEKSQRGDGAIMYKRTVRKFRIVDAEKIPREYLLVDEEKVNKMIKAGIAQIPGLEIYEENVTQLRAR